MNTEQILMYVVALILGMLLANMLKSVCGCKVVEGQTRGCKCMPKLRRGMTVQEYEALAGDGAYESWRASCSMKLNAADPYTHASYLLDDYTSKDHCQDRSDGSFCEYVTPPNHPKGANYCENL